MKQLNNKEIHKTSDLPDNNDIIYFTFGVENTLKLILTNIYSTPSVININNVNKVADNSNTIDKYSYSYVFTPNYFKTSGSFTIQAEYALAIPLTKSYNFILQKLPNKIATLDDVIITNVTNINRFNKNRNYYSSILNKDVKSVLTKTSITNTDNIGNISFHIKKTDPYSTVHTTMEYMDSNGDYIIFKETIEEFIDNILTLNKNAGSYKTIVILPITIPKKLIQNDANTEVINITGISNIRVKINVIAENKIVKNTYNYIIQI